MYGWTAISTGSDGWPKARFRPSNVGTGPLGEDPPEKYYEEWRDLTNRVADEYRPDLI